MIPVFAVTIVIAVVIFLIFAFIWWHGQTTISLQSLRIVNGSKVELSPGCLLFNRSTRTKWNLSWWEHVGIAFKDNDDVMKVAELFGRERALSVRDWDDYVSSASDSNVIGIRFLKTPLTDEQSTRLTDCIRRESNPPFNFNYILTVCGDRTGMSRVVRQHKGDSCASYVAKGLTAAGLPLPHSGSAFTITDFTAKTWTPEQSPYGPEVYIDKSDFPLRYVIV